MTRKHASIPYAFIGVLGLILMACSNSEKAAFDANGKPHRIRLYSGGQLIGEWRSTGKIENEGSSDGYYFQDAATKKLIRIAGQVIIEQE